MRFKVEYKIYSKRKLLRKGVMYIYEKSGLVAEVEAKKALINRFGSDVKIKCNVTKV